MTVATNSTWAAWVDYTVCTATTIDTWHTWSSATTGTTWGTWCTGIPGCIVRIVREDLSPAEREAWIEREREANRHNDEWQKKLAEEQAKRAAAEARAAKLLEENLALQERQRLAKDGHFIVHGRSGCRYRIRRGRSGNVDVIDRQGMITARLCIHPIESVPDSDTMLAQKLMIEHDEQEFNRVANRTPYNAGPVLEPLH